MYILQSNNDLIQSSGNMFIAGNEWLLYNYVIEYESYIRYFTVKSYANTWCNKA